MGNKYILEVCAFNIQSCIVAEQVGAQRIELCDNPKEGGTTPSYGTIRRVKEKVSISLYPIIRPRAGDFLYNEDEFAIMRKDIEICKQLGCEGISTGIQLEDGSIDTERMKRLVEWAYPMGVTCHKAFDITPDPFTALEALIGCGCERILTSGLGATAADGIDTLAKLVAASAGRIIIMPGGGVRANNIGMLAEKTGAKEFHTSARTIVQSVPSAASAGLGDIYITDEKELRAILSYMK
ncbi:MAG: copper homeostasis protein CutC [Bacteroidetes bacterium]|nr:copper homeostasis protein CutC [Bacteroidota bacterium]